MVQEAWSEHDMNVPGVPRNEAGRAPASDGHAYADFVLDAIAASDFEADLRTGSVRPSARLNALCGFAAEHRLTVEDLRAHCDVADVPRIQALLAHAFQPGQHRFDIEFRWHDGGPLTRWFLARGEILAGADGRPERVRGAAIDITERKQAEDDVREGRERFAALVESWAQAVWEADAGGNTTVDSPSWRAYTGQSLDDYLRNGWANAVHPDDREYVQRAWREAVREQMPLDAEFRLRGPDGGWRWTNVRAAPLRNADGSVRKWVGMNIDIGDRKLTEEALRDAFDSAELERLRLAAVLEALPAGVAIADAKGRIVQFNTALVRLWGAPPPAVKGIAEYGAWRGRWSHSGKPIEPDEWAMARTLRTGQVVPGDVVEIDKFDGTAATIVNAAAPVRDIEGRIVGGVVAAIDITAQRRAEEALQDRERRLRAALSAGRMGTWHWDLREKRFRLDDGLRRLLEVGGAAQVGTPHEFVRLLHPDDRERVEEAFMRCVEEGRSMDIEFRVLRAGGGVRWLKDQGDVFHGSDGRPRYFAGACMDITDRKAMEEALKDADRRKDEFLAMLAHELRNPLAPIVNATHVLRRLGPLDPKIERLREMIARQAEQLTTLVDDLLEVSRITQGRITLRKEDLELTTAISRAIDTSRPLIDARRHQLEVVLPAHPVRVEADPARLAQSISNLLNNAAKYTDEGGRIELRVEEAGPEVIVRVIDNGMGIAPQDLERIFELFTQSQPSLDRAQGGLGIGLTIVRKLVEMHGGRVDARSDGLGQGSEFVMRLPRGPVHAARPLGDDAHAPRERPRQAVRVLVVDDNVDAASSLGTLLELDGYEVELAYDGHGAIDAARRFRPDVLLLDIGLPGLNGLQVARELRRDPAFADKLFVALTGYGQAEDRRESRAAGFDHHLTKPIDEIELMSLLAAVAARQAPPAQ